MPFRGRRLGVSFRRQVQLLGSYIVDLLAPEVDGGFHERRGSADGRRDRALARVGYTVLRITEL